MAYLPDGLFDSCAGELVVGSDRFAQWDEDSLEWREFDFEAPTMYDCCFEPLLGRHADYCFAVSWTAIPLDYRSPAFRILTVVDERLADAMTDADNERLGCYVCLFHENELRGDARSRVYTVNGTEVVVGIGKGGRLVAHTKEHRPLKSTPEVFEFRQALLRWIDEHLPLDRRVLPLLTFGPMSRASNAHTAEHRLYPPVLTIASEGVENCERLYDPTGDAKDGKYVHPHLFANVFELIAHLEWPLRVADAYVNVAQQFAGYFWGKNVTAGQMKTVSTDERGEKDSSVVMTDETWVEPIELVDDCPMCQRMTDESVEERVEGFQWEINKESRSLKPLPLNTLPHRLKLTLCVMWNHVVRDWLKEDPRYCYADGHYYVVWTERLGGIDPRPTRSDSYGATTYAAAMAQAAGVMWTPPSPPPPIPEEPMDERDIWNEVYDA
jgi:hypothetical protein